MSFEDIRPHDVPELQIQPLAETPEITHVPDTNIEAVNRELERITGYDRTELLGSTVEVLIPHDVVGRHEGHRLGYQANPHRRAMGHGLELSARRKDGSVFPVEISLAPAEVAGDTVVIATVRDVTLNRQLDTDLQAARQRVVLAEDHERIARDLHDTVIQRLFASGLSLQSVLAQVPDTAKAKIERVLDDHDDAIRELRTAIFGLASKRSATGMVYRDVSEAFWKAGDIWKQPDLGAVFARMQKDGPREFYEGETARTLAAAMARNGGLITLEDLKLYKVVERAPLMGSYKGYGIDGKGYLEVVVNAEHLGTSVVPPGIHAEALARALPQAELLRIPGAGHLPHHAHAATIAEAIERLALQPVDAQEQRP